MVLFGFLDGHLLARTGEGPEVPLRYRSSMPPPTRRRPHPRSPAGRRRFGGGVRPAARHRARRDQGECRLRLNPGPVSRRRAVRSRRAPAVSGSKSSSPGGSAALDLRAQQLDRRPAHRLDRLPHRRSARLGAGHEAHESSYRPPTSSRGTERARAERRRRTAPRASGSLAQTTPVTPRASRRAAARLPALQREQRPARRTSSASGAPEACAAAARRGQLALRRCMWSARAEHPRPIRSCPQRGQVPPRLLGRDRRRRRRTQGKSRPRRR